MPEEEESHRHESVDSVGDVAVDVIIVGAGWSGILAAKYAREHGLSAIVLEARADIGGVWSFARDPQVVTVAEYTRTTSSAALTEASDFPMPPEFGPFPTHTQVLRYLNDYVDHFALRPHIRTSSPVRGVVRTGQGWQVETDRDTVASRFLVVSTGTHGRRNQIPFPCLHQFAGRILPADEVKERAVLLGETANQRVLVIGGGETAADIVEMLIRRGRPRAIDWSIPNGQRFVRKHGMMLPYTPFTKVVDEMLTTFSVRHIPVEGGRLGMSLYARLYTAASFVAHSGGHNVPEWATNARYFHTHFNKNGGVLDHVYDGRVGAKRRPIAVSGRHITFDRGSAADYDLIIACFGYKPKPLDFLPATHTITPDDCWRYIFHPDDPSLMFVGYARPVVTSIPLMTEAQCKLAARVMTGAVSLPEDLHTRIVEERATWREFFRDTSQRIGTLVEPISYFHGLMQAGGFEPDFQELFRRDPRGALIAYFAPMKAALLHLSEPERRDEAVANLKLHTDGWLIWASIYIYLMRVAHLDQLAQRIGRAKLRVEERFPALRRSRVYRGITHAYRRYLHNRDTFTRRTEGYTAALDEVVAEDNAKETNQDGASDARRWA